MNDDLIRILSERPCAVALLKGSENYPCLKGEVKFYQTDMGVLVYTRVNGLPKSYGKCKRDIFAFHIHEGKCCSGNSEDPFAHAKTHYNPENCEHPFHAGDLPPLWGNRGYAYSVFLTNRFTVCDIIGRTAIIHDGIDDFTTQPSGNAGEKIACGVIFA